MICPHCGNELHNVVETKGPINQPFNINAAANPIGYYSPIWNTGNAPIINPVNLTDAAPVAGTFTLIIKP